MKKTCLIIVFLFLALTIQADGIWQEHQMIDIHAHIGTFRGYDLSLETLLDNMKRYGISMALISNIDGADLPPMTKNLPETEVNSETARVVRLHPDFLRGLIWTRPQDGSSANAEPFSERNTGWW